MRRMAFVLAAVAVVVVVLWSQSKQAATGSDVKLNDEQLAQIRQALMSEVLSQVLTEVRGKLASRASQVRVEMYVDL